MVQSNVGTVGSPLSGGIGGSFMSLLLWWRYCCCRLFVNNYHAKMDVPSMKVKSEGELGEVSRSNIANRLRGLIDLDSRAFVQISRILVNVVQGDAAAIGFFGERFIYFKGRHGALPHRDVLAFPVSALDNRILIVPDVILLPGYTRMNATNGKFASYRSFIASPIRYDGETVAMLICYSNSCRASYDPEGKVGLLDLCSIAENLICYEAALANISRNAVETIEQFRSLNN